MKINFTKNKMENKFEQMATMSQINHQLKIFKNKKKYEKSIKRSEPTR